MKKYSLNHDFIMIKDIVDKYINEENIELTDDDLANEEIEEENKSKNSCSEITNEQNKTLKNY